MLFDVLDGLPALFDYVAGGIARTQHRASLALVIHTLSEDVINAADHALTHYLPLTLAEPYLQNSGIGTPYQKWAKFTNEDFAKLDECVAPPADGRVDVVHEQPRSRRLPGQKRLALVSFGLHRLRGVRRRGGPAGAHRRGDPPGGLGRARRRRASDGLCSGGKPAAVGERAATAAAADRHDDRSRHRGSHARRRVARAGHERVREMRASADALAAWLRANCTVIDLTQRHRGTLSSYSL
jgi:hypothetical protein